MVIRSGTTSKSSGSNAALDRAEDAAPSRVGNQDEVASLLEALRYTHPDYRAQYAKWDKYQNCYEADDIYKYIYKHIRETPEMWKKRVIRGYYYNYVASVVDLYVAYLFHSPIQRQVDKSIEELYEDIDLCGTTYNLFMQNIATLAQVSGHCGVLVDSPKVEKQPENEQERKEQNIRPFLTPVHAQQILDWDEDDCGKFLWVKLRIDKPQDRVWKTEFDETRETYIIWSRDGWEEFTVIDDVPQPPTSGDHDLDQVPLVIVRNERKPRHSWFGMSSVRDIADINIAILNWASLGDEECFERCLNILAMEQMGVDSTVELGHHNVLEYPSGANPPEYLTPGRSPLELIGAWIDRAKDEIYRLAKFGGSVGLQGVRQATSGIAYAFEFNETNQALSNKAESLEQAELEIHQLLSKWQGGKFTGSVKYPNEFGVEDFMLELQVLAEGRLNYTSETAVKELEKKVLSKMFSKDTTKLREQIMKEVEAADPFEPLTRGNPPETPPEQGEEETQKEQKPLAPEKGSTGD